MSNLAFTPPTNQKQSMSGPPALRESFVAWARHVAQKDRLQVVFGGNPATNGKVMWLPPLPYNLTEQDLLMVRSDIMHESGHCTDTDFEFFTRFGRQHGPLAQSLLNSIEDVRIEIARAKRYPGAEALIHDSNCLMMDTNRCRTGEKDAADALTTLCYMQGCVLRGWGGKHEEALQKAIGHLLNHLGKDAQPIIDQCIELLKAEYPALGSTQDAGRLTLKVIALFQDASDDNAQEQDSDDNSGGDDSKDEGSSDDSGDENSGEDDSGEGDNSTSDESGSDEGESEGESNDSGNGEGSKGESSEGSESGEGEGSGAGDDSKGENSEGSETGKGEGSEGESSEDSGDANGESGNDSKSGSAKAGQPSNGKSTASAIADMLGSDPGEEEVIDYHKAVQELADDSSTGKRPEYKNSPKVPEHSVDFTPEAKDKAGAAGVSDMSVVGSAWAEKDMQQFKRLEHGIQAKANVMLGQLQVLLRMATKTDWEESSRGRLNARKLYRAGFNDDRVFKRSSERVLPAAAVSVLTDLSSSMLPDRDIKVANVPSRLDQALQVQILLMKAMDAIGNPVEIAGFGGSKRNVTTLVKTFDEQPMVAQHRVGGMVHEAGGGTPLIEALMHASMRLSAREERRKVMFIITDGMPKDPNGVTNLMESCRSDGIHVVTFLIGFRSSERPTYLNNQDVVFVPSIDDLSVQSLSVIKEVCLGS